MAGSLSYYSALALSGACLGLSAVTVLTSRGNREVQHLLESQSQEAQAKQNEIRGRSQAIQTELQNLAKTEEIGRGILADMGSAAVSNEAMRALLAKHGYTLRPAGEGASAAAPAAPVTSVAPVAPTPRGEVVSEPVGLADAVKTDKAAKGDQ